MISSIKQELERVDQLILKGEYSEALKDIREIQENKDLTQEESIKTKLLESKIEYWLGIWCDNEQRLEKAADLANESLKESTKINSLLLMSEAFFRLAFVQWLRNKYEEWPWIFEKYSEIYEKIKSEKPYSAKEIEPYFYQFKGLLPVILLHLGREVSKGHLEESIQHFED